MTLRNVWLSKICYRNGSMMLSAFKKQSLSALIDRWFAVCGAVRMWIG